MAERKIRAGYYQRYDRKVVYVISLATDADTGEESVIWTTYPLSLIHICIARDTAPFSIISFDAVGIRKQFLTVLI